MATATALGPPGAETAQEQHARLLELDAQPSATRIRLPEGAARKVSVSVRRACIPDTYAASGPNRETGRILIPGDGARAFYAQQRAKGLGHNDALRRLANRLVGILHGCLKTRTPYDEATAWGHRETSANLPSRLDIQAPGMSFTPCVRSSRTRLTDDLPGMVTLPWIADRARSR